MNELELLKEGVSSCVLCDIAKTCKNKVFGNGNPLSKVMFIGECPGDEEDESGLPFQGKCGALINKYITAIGLEREDIYVCNLLKCRPKGSNNPNSEQANNCVDYLDRQIDIINPEFIVCWGSWSAQYVLDVDTPIGHLRGHLHNLNGRTILPTYHPSYALRNSSGLKPIWDDMKLLIDYLTSINYNVIR